MRDLSEQIFTLSLQIAIFTCHILVATLYIIFLILGHISNVCAHPISSTKSIPYSIALRIKRICSDPIVLQKRFKEYDRYLIARGYDANIVQQQFNKANVKSRVELLKPKQKSSSPAKKVRWLWIIIQTCLILEIL